MAVEVGDQAPDFTLTDDRGDALTLSSLRGRSVVLHFFPAAFSEVCTRQFRELADASAPYTGAHAALLAVSVDDAPTLAAFRESVGAADVTFLSDAAPRGAVSGAYGVFIPDRGHSWRATFVIDAHGVVRHADHHRIPLTIPDADAVRAALEACAR